MGNNSSRPHEVFSLESWDLSHLPVLKKHLGTRTPHFYDSHPGEIPSNLIHSNMDLRLFSCQESDYLNNFLKEINDNLQIKFLKENWQNEAFLSSSASNNFNLLHQEITGVELSETEIDELYKKLNLDKPMLNKDSADNNSTDNAGEDTGGEDGGVDNETSNLVTGINQVYRGYSIYEFTDEKLGMALDIKKVGIESCFVGSIDDNLAILAPSEEPNLSRTIRFDWTLVQVGKDKIFLILENAKGIIYESGKEMLDVIENYFEHLENANISFESNNGREMSLHSNKFANWSSVIQNEGELQAYVGGEVDGEIVSLSDFLEKMKLN